MEFDANAVSCSVIPPPPSTAMDRRHPAAAGHGDPLGHPASAQHGAGLLGHPAAPQHRGVVHRDPAAAEYLGSALVYPAAPGGCAPRPLKTGAGR